MKPLELLEYIEEIVDTRHYQEPLAALDAEIASQGEVKIRAYIQFTECSEVYKAVSEQSERVISSMKLRARFLYLQYLDLCLKHHLRTKHIERIKLKQRALDDEQTELDKQMEPYKKMRNGIYTEIEGLNRK